MPTRKVFHVTSRNGGWQVKTEGASRASSLHERKDEALAQALKFAHHAPSASQAVIHRSDGSVQESMTYG
jgi:hypothetical protein